MSTATYDRRTPGYILRHGHQRLYNDYGSEIIFY